MPERRQLAEATTPQNNIVSGPNADALGSQAILSSRATVRAVSGASGPAGEIGPVDQLMVGGGFTAIKRRSKTTPRLSSTGLAKQVCVCQKVASLATIRGNRCRTSGLLRGLGFVSAVYNAGQNNRNTYKSAL